MALTAFSGVVALASHPAASVAVGSMSFSAYSMQGDFVTFHCANGYIDLNKTQVCLDNTTLNYPWSGPGYTNYTVTAACNVLACNQSAPWGWYTSGVCIGVYPSCATYWVFPQNTSKVNMWTDCASGQHCTGVVSLWSIKPAFYNVYFNETGLYTLGTQWSVNFMGGVLSSTTASISTTAPNGSWPFSVTSTTGYSANPSSGAVAVSGTRVQQPIAFSSITKVLGNYTNSIGLAPYAVAYDNVSNYILVASNSSGKIAIVDDSTGTVVKNLPEGTKNFFHGIVYDWVKNGFYVADQASTSSTTWFYNITSGKNVSIAMKSAPYDLAFDYAKKEVFVTMPGYGVGVINTSKQAVTTNIALSTVQSGIVYDGGKGIVFTSDSAGSISAIYDSNLTVKTIALSGCTTPSGMAYDSSMGRIYVTCAGSSSVAVVSDSRMTQIGTISIGQSDPTHAAFAPGTGCIWVTDDLKPGKVTVIADSTGSNDTVVNTLTVGNYPVGIVYDSGLQEMFTANWGSNTLSYLST